MSPLEPRERRSAPRARTRSLLGYSLRIDDRCFGILGIGSTADLSSSGLRFVAYEAIPLESQLELELLLEGRPARIERASVVRTVPRRDGAFEVAVSFLDAKPPAREAIGRHVRELLSGERLAG